MCEVAERLENKGRAEERMETIERLLKKGKTPEEIHEFMDYPMNEIRKVAKSLFSK